MRPPPLLLPLPLLLQLPLLILLPLLLLLPLPLLHAILRSLLDDGRPAEALLELREPYRSAVILRHLDEIRVGDTRLLFLSGRSS